MDRIPYEIKATRDIGTVNIDALETYTLIQPEGLPPLVSDKKEAAELFWESIFWNWGCPTEGKVFIRDVGGTDWEEFDVEVEIQPVFQASKVVKR